MKLVVHGGPCVSKRRGLPNQITVDYDSGKQVTTVVMDSDIVTLGIAVNVLTNAYHEYLAQLDVDTAQRIIGVTKEATK